ncbi:MAG: CDC48 family AAA ATPase [Ignavibacteriales bacterium]|nr:CDC48 family AAA ATPase [Ignavibacteriales bacterium]
MGKNNKNNDTSPSEHTDNPQDALRVAEGLGKDVGRGLARLDPKDLEKLGIQVGDIIGITGKRATVAKVMPAFKEARGKGMIQIDGITRANAGVSLDEKITVTKISSKPASKIVIKPVAGPTALMKERDLEYMGKLLDGLPVVVGDRVRATLFGSRFQDFVVVSTIPREAVVIVAQTVIRVEEVSRKSAEEASPSAGQAGISYEDIGGLHKEIQRVREMIELPLKYPQLFERLGIEPPKGVLLHGPPGCGKTLLARAVAYETSANFYAVSGPEIIHKFYGESEAKLREVFEQARLHAPSIVFMDELDSIAPKREQVFGDVEKRVVAQLLALMDGLKGRGQVIVIGATNLPNALDPALRRPGRFDREIVIGIPDSKAREEILDIHTRGMPLRQDVDVKRLAEMTHGFTGADLNALCREAAMTALRRIMPKIEFNQDVIPYELLMELEVTADDMLSALAEVEPSAIREVFVEIPKVRWDDIGGLEDIRERLIEAVEWPLKYSALFKHAVVKPPKGIILHGVPGTGKTLLAKALASEAGVNFISVKGPQLMSKYVGEAERAVREVFKKARQASPCILFFDELDSIAPTRGVHSGDSGVSERVMSQMLTEMDGIEELRGVLVLAATNRIDMIDTALLRPGRFDFLLELPPPDQKSRFEIFKIHTRGKPLAQDVDLKVLAKETEGEVGADIEAICSKASMNAIREFLSSQRALPERGKAAHKVEDRGSAMDAEGASEDYLSFEIGQKHFLSALKEVVRKDEV